MELLENFSKVGTSKSQYQNAGKASASCILWRILHFLRDLMDWNCYNMDLDLLELGPKYLVLMTSIFASTQKNLKTSGEVCIFDFFLSVITLDWL